MDKFLNSNLKAVIPQGNGTESMQLLSPAGNNHNYLMQNESDCTRNICINLRDPDVSQADLGIDLKHQNQSENVSSKPSSQLIAGMEEDCTISDLEELNTACKAITAERDISDELILCLQQGKDTDSIRVLSSAGEDHVNFSGAHNLYFFPMQSHASKALIEDDWPSLMQSTSDFQKYINTEKYNDTVCSAEFEGVDLEPIHIKSGLLNLSIKARDPEICLDDLEMIHVICQNPPEEIFSNQPGSQFIAWKVSYTKEECLYDCLRQLEPSSHTQGCVLKEMLSVEEGEYTEGKHFTHKNLYQGAYGKVDLCQDCSSGYEFIRKKIPMDKFKLSEVLFPLTIKHKNIMKICGVIQRVEMDGGNVMEILLDNAGMSLVQFVMNQQENETLSQVLIWDLMKQALEGLSMLHSKGIIHLDIKPENLCIQKDYLKLTIADFGSAIEVGQEMDFIGWTPEYMAPESCRCYLQHALQKGVFSGMNNQITGKVDVFALGLTALFLHDKKHVLLNLMTGGQNSYGGHSLEDKRLLQLHLLLHLASQEDPVGHLISDDCSMDMRDLLSRMLAGSADMRPTAEEALAFMTARVQEVKQTMNQSAAPKPDVLPNKKRNTRVRYSPSNPQFKTEKGQLVTQPSCNSSDHIPRMIEVPVCQVSLPESINSLQENEPGPIKDHSLKQRLREKLNPYLKTKIWVPKEIEASNSTPMGVKHSSSAYTQSPTSFDLATSKIENCKTNIGHNFTQAERLGITQPVQPSSPTDQSFNKVVLSGNIPNFDVLVNI